MRKRVAEKDINGRMEHTRVRNNKDTNNISNFEKQEATVTSSVTVTLRIWTLWRSIYRNN